jgi:hypothetical protein
MRTLGQWILGLFLLTGGATAYAQSSCPPGMVPYGTGTGVNMCGYDDSQQPANQQPAHAIPQRPPEQWADHWGAIATYGPTVSLGTSNDMPSKGAAEQAALDRCHAQHGSICSILTYYRNGCGVMVIDGPGKYYVADFGATLDEATRKTIQTCVGDGHQNCHVFYSGCSFPQRLQ